MIPLVAEFCVKVDVAARRIIVNPPEGLFELNASPRRRAADRGARTPE